MRLAALVLALAPPTAAAVTGPWGALELLGDSVPPGERRELALEIGESFAGFSVTTPVLVLRGVRPGPTLCLTGGIHGDEVNGIEIVRRALLETGSESLAGTVVGVPIVNLYGFRRSSRYLPDRRDLNRHFPGNPEGSAASRIAHLLFASVIRRCDGLVDFHTGSFHRRNLPQVRANLLDPAVRELAMGFGPEIVVHTVGTHGTLRRAAVEAGIPSITYEAGEPMEFRDEEVQRGVEGVRRLLSHLAMKGPTDRRGPPQIFYRSRWVRADDGGIFLATVGLGSRVRPGQVLGHVTDPISNERTEVVSPHAGRVIGMAVNQVVLPGFAAFHLGIDGGQPDPEPDDEPVDALDEPVELDERPE